MSLNRLFQNWGPVQIDCYDSRSSFLPLYCRLTKRVPEISKSDLNMLATVGALTNISIDSGRKLHRRDAFWQVQKFASRVPWMLAEMPDQDESSPFSPMTTEERLVTDYHGTAVTIGPHPMFYRREELRRMGILAASELKSLPNNRPVIAAVP